LSEICAFAVRRDERSGYGGRNWGDWHNVSFTVVWDVEGLGVSEVVGCWLAVTPW
jgi:hypothetical protein